MCTQPDCEQPPFRRDMCVKHYTRWRKTQMPPCSNETCDKPAANYKTGLCSAHYYLYLKYGSPTPEHLTTEWRFWAFVNKTDTCWLWTGAVVRGYGVFSPKHDQQVRAHRYSYEMLVGPIPAGLHIDHVWPRCTSPLCVRPDHLEPVSIAENNRRAAAKITHCPRGHGYTEENTYRTKTGKRQCRACARERRKRNRVRSRP